MKTFSVTNSMVSQIKKMIYMYMIWYGDISVYIHTKQGKTTNKRNIFFTNKGVEILLKFCSPRMLFLKCLLVCLKMIFLLLLINYSNRSDPNYSTTKQLYNLLKLALYRKWNHSAMPMWKFTLYRSWRWPHLNWRSKNYNKLNVIISLGN